MPATPRPVSEIVSAGFAGAVGAPRIVTLADGTLLVTAQVDGDFFAAIHGQAFSPQGEPLGETFVIETAINLVRGYDIAALPDGGFAAAFLAANAITLLGRSYDLVDGAPVERAGQQAGIADFADFDDDFGPTIAARGDSGFLLQAVSNGAEGRAVVEAREGESAGDGGRLIASVERAALTSATLEGGAVALVIDPDGADGAAALRILLRGPEGEALAEVPFAVPGEIAAEPAVAALPGGGFAVSATSIAGGAASVVFQVFDAEGTPVSGVETLASGGEGAAVAALPDGGFLLVFEDDGGPGPQVRAQRFDAAGEPTGEEVLVAARAADGLQATTLADGRVAVAFRVEGGGVETRILSAPVEIPGTEGDDRLTGTAGDDLLRGFGGDDVLVASAGADVLDGGAGRDTADYSGATVGLAVTLATPPLGGGAPGTGLVQEAPVPGAPAQPDPGRDAVLIGIERFLSGAGDDTIAGTGARDEIDGGAGADEIEGLGGADRLSGGRGADRIEGGAGDDRLGGGKGADLLAGGAGADEIVGGKGRDGADYAASDAGVQVDLKSDGPQAGGHAEGDRLSSIELLRGSAFADALRGTGGEELFLGGAGDDLLFGRAGADELVGEAGADRLLGQKGADALTGGGGADELRGGAGADRLKGGGGADLLAGGAGDDRLKGGGGADRFVFGAGDGRDVVQDYAAGVDALSLDRALLDGAGSGEAAVAGFASLSDDGRAATFRFGGGDVLTLKSETALDLDALAQDIGFF